jgi:hypothetical protein
MPRARWKNGLKPPLRPAPQKGHNSIHSSQLFSAAKQVKCAIIENNANFGVATFDLFIAAQCYVFPVFNYAASDNRRNITG